MARQSSLLIIGCGDVGLRVVRALGGRLRVFALTSSPQRCDALRAAGVRPLIGDLDDPSTLGRLAGLADAVLYLAPPPATGHTDPRLRALLGALSRRTRPARVTREQADEHFSAAQWSFLNESRRLSNERMKRELRLRLRWPTVRESLAAECVSERAGYGSASCA